MSREASPTPHERNPWRTGVLTALALAPLALLIAYVVNDQRQEATTTSEVQQTSRPQLAPEEVDQASGASATPELCRAVARWAALPPFSADAALYSEEKKTGWADVEAEAVGTPPEVRQQLDQIDAASAAHEAAFANSLASSVDIGVEAAMEPVWEAEDRLTEEIDAIYEFC